MEPLTAFVPAATEWSGVHYSLPLIGIILAAGLGTATLFALSVLAFVRRRTRQYLLVTVALGALVVRSVVGLGTVLALVPMSIHHLVGHGLDVLIAAFVLLAIYLSGPTGHQHPPQSN
ncbi:hypothetical protein HAPAU_11490 [Halalkalicoccus paucihalophilus]|uniref:Uncharacterized protein n=1 Tax=Halalkalicoccus paucihalophilus TaxID=1008153 RepID=A0A151AED6_9EURY|nr:hypothetical protein [Halalkalicoccus paucihalophilus]KYH26058.1 hypothetical protein HAPAU_11490 [Halalkalicoccus paucihalophilus]